jgi:hypothetical protein
MLPLSSSLYGGEAAGGGILLLELVRDGRRRVREELPG